MKKFIVSLVILLITGCSSIDPEVRISCVDLDDDKKFPIDLYRIDGKLYGNPYAEGEGVDTVGEFIQKAKELENYLCIEGNEYPEPEPEYYAYNCQYRSGGTDMGPLKLEFIKVDNGWSVIGDAYRILTDSPYDVNHPAAIMLQFENVFGYRCEIIE